MFDFTNYPLNEYIQLCQQDMIMNTQGGVGISKIFLLLCSTLFFYTYDMVWPNLKSKQAPQLRVKLPKSDIVCQATTKNVCCFRQKFIERDDHCMSALNRCFKSNSS